MDTFTIGDVILGKYEITRVLGKGGMGTVVAAKRLDVGLPVALKFLHRSLGDAPEVLARFRQEAIAGMRIKSPHVPQVHDVVIDGDRAFLVMEYLTGQDLAAVLKESGPLAPPQLVDLLLQACEAIAEAHALGIVHRDLKPANLFLTTGPDHLPSVKVLDFGIAKSTDPADLSVTATTGTLGSPRYMSPEQLASAKAVDARTDVWSLGVIAYELLTGVPPFEGETFSTVSDAVRAGAYTRLTERRPELPVELEDVVAEALLVDRDDRLPSVEALAAGLAPFGTDRAKLSLALIRRVAGTVPVSVVPGSTPAAPVRSAQIVTVKGPALTSETKPPPVRVEATQRPRGRALGGVAAALVALGALAFGVARRPRHVQPVPSATPVASVATPVESVPDARADVPDAATPAPVITADPAPVQTPIQTPVASNLVGPAPVRTPLSVPSAHPDAPSPAHAHTAPPRRARPRVGRRPRGAASLWRKPSRRGSAGRNAPTARPASTRRRATPGIPSRATTSAACTRRASAFRTTAPELSPSTRAPARACQSRA